MISIYYINSKGERLELVKEPYRLQTSDIFDYSWEYENVSGIRYRGTITKFVKNITSKSLVLTIGAKNQKTYYEALNRFFEVVDYDVVHKTRGRLYIGSQYMLCYIHASEKTEWEYGIESLDNTVSLVTDYPYWIEEKQLSFFTKGQISSHAGTYLDYPYPYAFDYAIDGSQSYVENDHYKTCEFEMVIYGPCTNPKIVIGGHTYEVLTSLNQGEYLKINSREGTIVKNAEDGAVTNEFNNRNKESSVFERIPVGNSIVTWSGDYGFDVILFMERSEPKWTL